MSDVLGEHCGIFGIYGHNEAVDITYLGLYSLQHRGQESAGIVVSDGRNLRSQKGMGLVADVFSSDSLSGLRGNAAIGHVRYSTTGSSTPRNIQPFLVNYLRGQIAIAHNGNIVNALSIRRRLEEEGSIFQSTMDSEVVIQLLARKRRRPLEDALSEVMREVRGAYSMVLLTEGSLIACRDPNGFRPLSLGRLDSAYVIASETCAFDLVGASYIRDVEPGELMFIDENGLRSFKPYPNGKLSHCIFEYIYFSRPDSNVFGANVHKVRKELGKQLARECPVEADMVVPIPDSGVCAALGFSEESGIPFEMAIIRNHYVGRTFIQPSQKVRDLSVKVKLNPIRDILRGKRVVIIEDSIVRGTTSRVRVRNIREAGASEVHMRVSCPPHRFPCFYGIDFPTREELIASNHTVEEIRDYLNLDSLGYLSLEGMLSSMPLVRENFCVCCFTGEYPVPVEPETSKEMFERFGI